MIQLVQVDIQYIKSRSFASKYAAHIKVLEQSEFDYKTKYELFPRSSTVYNKRYIRVTTDYPRWSQKDRCAHLIHEAQHCLQYDKLVGGMDEMEREASNWQYNYLKDAR